MAKAFASSARPLKKANNDVSERASGNQSICIGKCGMENNTVYYLTSVFHSPLDKAENGTAFVAPFWLVQTTHVQEEANMLAHRTKNATCTLEKSDLGQLLCSKHR